MQKFYPGILYCVFFLTFPAHGQIWQPLGDPIHGEHISYKVGTSFEINDKGDKIIVGYSNRAYTKVKVFHYQNNNWEQLGDTLKEPEMYNQFGYGLTMNGPGNIIGISAFDSNKKGVERGYTKMYQYEDARWKETGNIDGSNAGDRFGMMIASNRKGNVLAIGQQNSIGCPEGSVCGKITVFENKGSEWLQKGNVLSASINSFRHEFSLDSTGNILALINYPKDKDEKPLIVIDIYKFKNQAWTKTGKSISINNNHIGNNATIALSGNGNYLVVGLPNLGPNDLVVSGQVKVYKLADNGSVQLGENMDGEKKYDYFGSSVDINNSGDVIAIGTFRKKDGYVKTFRNEHGKWIQVGQVLKGCNARLNGSGNIVLVGDSYENNEQGVINAYSLK